MSVAVSIDSIMRNRITNVNAHAHYSIVHSLGMTLSDFLQALMDKWGDNPNSLATRSKAVQSTIFRILEGTSLEPRSSTREKLGRAFGVLPEAFSSEKIRAQEAARLGLIPGIGAEHDVSDPIPVRQAVYVPLVGEVMGGSDGYLDEFGYPVGSGEGSVEYPTKDENAYALRVRGDSMHPRYRAGEFVIIEPNIEPQEGDDVVVICANGQKMLKQLNWRRGDEVQFLSINNGYGPMTLKKTEITRIQLVAGRARSSALRKD